MKSKHVLFLILLLKLKQTSWRPYSRDSHWNDRAKTLKLSKATCRSKFMSQVRAELGTVCVASVVKCCVRQCVELWASPPTQLGGPFPYILHTTLWYEWRGSPSVYLWHWNEENPAGVLKFGLKSCDTVLRKIIRIINYIIIMISCGIT